jgi:hypothetical protein
MNKSAIIFDNTIYIINYINKIFYFYNLSNNFIFCSENLPFKYIKIKNCIRLNNYLICNNNLLYDLKLNKIIETKNFKKYLKKNNIIDYINYLNKCSNLNFYEIKNDHLIICKNNKEIILIDKKFNKFITKNIDFYIKKNDIIAYINYCLILKKKIDIKMLPIFLNKAEFIKFLTCIRLVIVFQEHNLYHLDGNIFILKNNSKIMMCELDYIKKIPDVGNKILDLFLIKQSESLLKYDEKYKKLKNFYINLVRNLYNIK